MVYADYRDQTATATQATWDKCFETLFELPKTQQTGVDLYVQAARIVRSCRSETRDGGIDRMAAELGEAHGFVYEHFLADPGDRRWTRLTTILSAANSALRGPLDNFRSEARIRS